MGLLSWLKEHHGTRQGTSGKRAATAELALPWDNEQSIYEHIREHLNSVTGELAPEGVSLSDQERFSEISQLYHLMPGEADGLTSHHTEEEGSAKRARILGRLIVQFCQKPTTARLRAVYEYAMDDSVLEVVDPLLEMLWEANLESQWLYELGHWLTTESPDRGPLKLGIAILGLFPSEDNRNLLMTLGLHEEFTLFSAVAICHSIEEHHKRDEELWLLAKHVHGWGRIHLVERLCATHRRDIKWWLITDGFRNTIMNQYTAFGCAEAADLADLLENYEVGYAMDIDPDGSFLLGAGDIINALINGGPAKDMDSYSRGSKAVARYVEIMLDRASELQHFLTIANIKRFVNNEQDALRFRRLEKGWTPLLRDKIAEQCEQIMHRHEWENMAMRTLADVDDKDGMFDIADQAAQIIGFDTCPFHWRRVRNQPDNPEFWFTLLQRSPAEEIEDVVTFAEESLPLKHLATGPDTVEGLGENYAMHNCLDFIIQALRYHPGHGEHLIYTGLQSPVIRNRRNSLRTLSAWSQSGCDQSKWPMFIRQTIGELIQSEPVGDVKRLADQLKSTKLAA